MYNLDENQTTLQILAPDPHVDHIRESSQEAADYLNL